MGNDSINFCRNSILSLIDSLPLSNQNRGSLVSEPKFVFLCGKGILNAASESARFLEQTNRGMIRQYLENKGSYIKFAISEELWEDASYTGSIDLLSFEEFLADVSSYIILLVESMGSACELGAFSSAGNGKDFIKKMIIILDKKYRGDKSFILTGPVKKAEQSGASIVFADIENGSVLLSRELLEKLDSIAIDMRRAHYHNLNLDMNNIDLYAFILDMIELLQLLQPIGSRDIISIYKHLRKVNKFTLPHNMRVDYVFNFLEKTRIVQRKNDTFHLVGRWGFKKRIFSCTLHEFNRTRNLILAKRFKHKDWNYCHEFS